MKRIILQLTVHADYQTIVEMSIFKQQNCIQQITRWNLCANAMRQCI